MPSLWKRDNSPFWFACYTSAAGQRLKKSTKQRDRTKALEVALALERAEDMARRGTLTETRTRALLGEVLERTTGETLRAFTVEGWLREWLKGKGVAKSVSTHRAYGQTVEAFLAHLGARARLNLAAITPADVSAFRDVQSASGKSPNTVRHLVKQLRIPFNAARRQGIITTNPAEAVELPPRAKDSEGNETSREAFTPEQVEALMQAAALRENKRLVFDAGDEWRLAILTGYLTGARLRDVCNLTWSAIDLPAKLLTYRAQKTGKQTRVPLHPALESALLALPAPDTGKAFLFPRLAARGTGGRSGLSMAFARIMARAGVQGEVMRAKTGAGRTTRTLSFHSLRHSFNSQMANGGVSQEVRMKLTGHASADMNRGYTHHELEPLRVAIETIPAPAAPKEGARK
jgi:integrase